MKNKTKLEEKNFNKKDLAILVSFEITIVLVSLFSTKD